MANITLFFKNMLDIKFIRENPEAIKKAAKEKNLKVDVDRLLEVDELKRKFMQEMEGMKAEQNKLSKEKPDETTIKNLKELKGQIKSREDAIKDIEKEFKVLMNAMPTIPSEDTPDGKSEQDNVTLLEWGEKPKFDFEVKDHVTIAKNLDLIDFERGAKVAGYRGYYMKNDGVLLQMGMMLYALKKMVSKGYTPMIPPTLVKEFALAGSGYFKSGIYNPETDEIYKVSNEEKLADGTIDADSRFLVGTAEPSLLAYYAGEVLEEKDLPIKICGFSQCYRTEIGSYGKETKGIQRVHEFMKVEMVTICPADKELSSKLHDEMFAVSKEIHEELGLPYRQLAICKGDLTTGKYKQYDIEAWVPSKNGYAETGSASNFLDWQSRRLNVRYNTKNGEKKFVYMLNNTGLVSPRPIIAILENYQQADGSVRVPTVLREYIGKETMEIKGN